MTAPAAETLEVLLRSCTVRVLGGPAPGAGFFVAPGTVLTCAHVIGDSSSVMVLWEWCSREPEQAQVVSVLADRGRPIPDLACGYPDLAVLRVDGFDGHPCVAIEMSWPAVRDDCLMFGYPMEGGSVQLTPALLTYRSPKGVAPTEYLDLKSDRVKPGMSGSALLNLRTRKVCGVTVATKDPLVPDGGLAVPLRAVETDLNDVLAANRAFHEADGRWAEAASQPDHVLGGELFRLHCEFMNLASGELWRVADLGSKVTALQLGVHKAARLDLSAGSADPARYLPPYVGRDVDRRLDAAIADGGLVLLTGDSMAGKSRTAYEALRRLARNTPDIRLLVPRGRESLRELADHGVQLRGTVVWLSDLEGYLGPGGLDAGLLYRLTGPEAHGAAVLATMRDNEYGRRRSGSGRESKAERELLELATVIELDREFSVAENARAAALSSDPRIRAAWEHRREFGLAEYLGAGPELRDRWRSGRGTSNDGYVQVGSAIVSAAIDCRRAGLTRPTPEALLRSLYPSYLKGARGLIPGQALFHAGLAYATEPVDRTTVACLEVADGGYRASDYLLDEAQKDEAAPSVPDGTWKAVLAEIEPPDAWEVGREAYWASRATFAEEAFRTGLRSADQEVISRCALGLADVARLLDFFDEARDWRERAEHPERLPDHPDQRSEAGMHLAQSAAEQWYLMAGGVGGDAAHTLVIEHEHVVLAFDGKDYRHTITRVLRNESAEAIDRYPFRIAVARYPDDPVKNDAQYVKYPLTVEGSQVSAWYEAGPLGRQPMDWVVEQDRPSFKEIWLLFKHSDLEFPLLSGQSGSVTYQYTASCQHWGPWSKRKVRLKTGKLSLEFSFPARMLPDIVGFEWIVAKTPTPMDISRHRDGDRVVFAWEVLNPPLNAQYQFNWRLGNDPDKTTS